MSKSKQSRSAKSSQHTFLSYWQIRSRLRRSILPAAFVLIFVGFGVYFLTSSHAASPYVSTEAENGTLQGNACITQDTNASNKEAVEFGGNCTSSSCAPSGVCVPVGNLPGWNQVFETNFPGIVPVGAFSGCGNGATLADTYCTGLQPYSSYYNDWWAYPSGWPDTAEECIEGSSQCPDTSVHPPIGGLYQPQQAVSVSNNAMHINMSSPTNGGTNVVATVVPRLCADQLYGMYTERFKVVQENPGFKSAHLWISGNFETDYPENDYGQTISAYTHPGGANFSTSAQWTSWHTTTVDWTVNSIQFYMDGQLIGTATNNVPNIAMDWILQNESSILGPYASPGATAELDIAWVACYTEG